MKGYKAFEKGLVCRGKQYTVHSELCQDGIC